MHLTNSSLNKHSQQYVPNVDAEEDASGSKWSLAALKRQVARDFGEARAASAWEQIDDLVVKTVISVEPAMSAGTRAFVPRCAGGAHNTQCFQLFGFDVMLDANCRPWLLEVNLDPALGTESPLDLKVKSSLLIDLLNLVGVPAPSPADSASGVEAGTAAPASAAAPASSAASAAGGGVDAGASQGTPPEQAGEAAAAAAARPPAAPTTADEEAEVVRHVNAQFARSKAGSWRRLFPAPGAPPPRTHTCATVWPAALRLMRGCARMPRRRRPLPRVPRQLAAPALAAV